jgi:hypothetical protein
VDDFGTLGSHIRGRRGTPVARTSLPVRVNMQHANPPGLRTTTTTSRQFGRVAGRQRAAVLRCRGQDLCPPVSDAQQGQDAPRRATPAHTVYNRIARRHGSHLDRRVLRYRAQRRGRLPSAAPRSPPPSSTRSASTSSARATASTSPRDPANVTSRSVMKFCNQGTDNTEYIARHLVLCR